MATGTRATCTSRTVPQYKYHLEHYGHPSKVGYKDLVTRFKGDKFNADHLLDLYSKAGAKYFVSMAVHHDNFDMWNSEFQPKWNAHAMGPRRDIVGLFRNAARKRGLKFGVSEHLSNSYDWLAVSHLSDKTGPLAGVPYDGADPKFADLYHDLSAMPPDFAKNAKAMGREAPDAWKLQYFRRIKDLIDQHAPDLLYTDGGIPFDEYGLSLVAHLYNLNALNRGGKVEAVYNSKVKSDCAAGTCVLDLERGIVDKIWPDPWQTDTCIGTWHYKRGVKYKTPKTVIDMLCDIVSRNGNLLLNFPLPNSGELDPEELQVLAAITDWMKINSEGIYATRPWKISGEGPSMSPVVDRSNQLAFNENRRKDLTAEDIRFTTKGNVLYCFIMGWPGKEAVVKSVKPAAAKVLNAELLGRGKVTYSQDEAGLRVQLPESKPGEHAVVLKLSPGLR